MHFRRLGIEWRYDTLINTIAIVILGIACTIAITRSNSATTREVHTAVTQMLIIEKSNAAAVGDASQVIGQLALIRAEHKNQAAQEEKNFELILQLEKQLIAKRAKQ